MANYFVNRSRFVPPKNETDLSALDTLTGVLEYYEKRPGNNASGSWFVIRIKTEETHANIFFEPENVGPDTPELLDGLKGRRIRLRCKNGRPLIQTIDADSESEIRAEMLRGVAAGHITVEDLPALFAFAKGEDSLFEKWSVFKKQIESEGLNKTRETVDENVSRMQRNIEQEKAKLNELEEIYNSVIQEKNAMLRDLQSALMLLQGEDSLQGTCSAYYHGETPETIPIGNGYRDLVSAFQKAGTRKGIYVICENKIHRIHHIFLEDKGRAFLLGTEKEYLKANQEKVKEIIDTIGRWG